MSQGLNNWLLAQVVQAICRQLHKMTMWVRAPQLKVECLSAIGRACLDLEHLQLVGRYDMDMLNMRGLLFPHLHTLHLTVSYTRRQVLASRSFE